MTTSPYRNLFNKERFISSNKLVGSDNLYAVAKYLTKELIEETLEKLRKTTENTDNL